MGLCRTKLFVVVYTVTSRVATGEHRDMARVGQRWKHAEHFIDLRRMAKEILAFRHSLQDLEVACDHGVDGDDDYFLFVHAISFY